MLKEECKHKKTTTWTHRDGSIYIDCDKCGKIMKRTKPYTETGIRIYR